MEMYNLDPFHYCYQNCGIFYCDIGANVMHGMDLLASCRNASVG